MPISIYSESSPHNSPLVTVLMPTFEQSAFICRALESLLAQTFTDWELLIIDDGSRDQTEAIIAPFLTDHRIKFYRGEENRGLGAALNLGLSLAGGLYIAYLPSDDVIYRDHLASLVASLESNPEAIAALSGVRHHYNKTAPGVIPGSPLQLVQALHRRSDDRWLERADLVTDDLAKMYWDKLTARGEFVGTGQVSCEWVNHPAQRHKVIQEPEGGINPYRRRYRVSQPLRFHSSAGNFIDEVSRYQAYRERPDTPFAKDGLKILLVGELAYNADRVLALEERGHRLYGLWLPNPHWYNYVGPLPFGHVEDLPPENWQEAVRSLQPDIIYGLLNWQAVPFAYAVRQAFPDIPFVWHFKEGPFICLERGTWPQLLGLYRECDGQIYCSPEMRDWFYTVAPELAGKSPCLVLDGDLPRQAWFKNRGLSRRLSEDDGQPHTVVPGRPIGLHAHLVGELAQAGVHLHFYGDYTQGQWQEWIIRAERLAPGFLHLHQQVDQENWVEEFSKYDAGWLHFFQSENQGELRRSNWDDLNIPARLATLAVAGVPVLQRDNTGAIVATQSLVRQLDIGLFFSTMAELGNQLRDEARLEQLRTTIRQRRDFFTFDYHANELISFFRQVIAARKG